METFLRAFCNVFSPRRSLTSADSHTVLAACTLVRRHVITSVGYAVARSNGHTHLFHLAVFVAVTTASLSLRLVIFVAATTLLVEQRTFLLAAIIVVCVANRFSSR